MGSLTVDSFLFCFSLGVKIVFKEFSCREISVNGFHAQIPTVAVLRDTYSKF